MHPRLKYSKRIDEIFDSLEMESARERDIQFNGGDYYSLCDACWGLKEKIS